MGFFDMLRIAKTFLVLAAVVRADDTGACPCPAGQAVDTDCKDCHRVRCRIGGWAVSRECEGSTWCPKASADWVKNCQAQSDGSPWSSPKTICGSVADACGAVCGAMDPPDKDCAFRCTVAQNAASHTCASFPWPELPPVPTTQFPPSGFGQGPNHVYT